MTQEREDQVEDELLPATDPRVQRLLGVHNNRHPDQAAYRLAREKRVPHLRNGKSVRFSLRVLREWVGEQARANIAA